MAFFDFLLGGGTTKTEQKYVMSPEERALFNKIFPVLNFGTSLGEARIANAPQIRGIENYARTAAAPYGGGAELQTGLRAKSSVFDLLNQYALQRQQGVQGSLANLLSGKGTQVQTTKAPMDFGGLGRIIGLYLAMQGMGGLG